MKCELTNTPENQINPHDYGTINEKYYSQAIANKVSEYIENNDDLDDVILNDDATLQAVRLMYRAHTEGNELGFETWAKAACMNIDSYLMNRAEKEIG